MASKLTFLAMTGTHLLTSLRGFEEAAAIHEEEGTSAFGGGMGKLNIICNRPLRLDHEVNQV